MSGWISPAWIACISTGYVVKLKLQTAGGVIYFFHDHRGKPIASPALFEPIGEKFRRDIKDWARVNGIPMIRFGAGDRKADVMAPYLVGAVDAAGARPRAPWSSTTTFMPARSSRRCCARTWTWAGRRTSSCCSAAGSDLDGPAGRRRAAGSRPRSTGTATCTLNVFYKSSRVKQYLKDGVAPRIETVVNSPLTCAATGRSRTCLSWRARRVRSPLTLVTSITGAACQCRT